MSEGKKSLGLLQFVSLLPAGLSLFVFVWYQEPLASVYWILAALFLFQFGSWK